VPVPAHDRRASGCDRRRRRRLRLRGWAFRLLFKRSFDGFAAAGIELQKRRNLVFWLRRRGDSEARRGGGAGFGYVGMGSDELEQVEGDVFGATGGGGGLFHERRIAKGGVKGSGSRVQRKRSGCGKRCGGVVDFG